MGRNIALLFHDRDTRRWWVVSSTIRPHFAPGKDPGIILQEDGWAPGPVWIGRKFRPHRDSIPDRPACSKSLYRLSYPASPPPHTHTYIYIYMCVCGNLCHTSWRNSQYINIWDCDKHRQLRETHLLYCTIPKSLVPKTKKNCILILTSFNDYFIFYYPL
jgi:hypothetical protein